MIASNVGVTRVDLRETKISGDILMAAIAQRSGPLSVLELCSQLCHLGRIHDSPILRGTDLLRPSLLGIFRDWDDVTYTIIKK
mmetsp:Transcript_16529/g.34734  ORF Transcript_16529/g.34734 Transcript_16529/m.34734 type:complete len:83 (+) Transcript_16529:2081-2329(+)